MARLMLSVLGALRVLQGDTPVKFESDKARALLVYLAVEAQSPHRRDSLIGLLWPDASEETARHNLRQTLFHLRQTIDDRSAKPPYFHVTRQDLQFNADSDHTLDLAAFDSHLKAVDTHEHEFLEDCTTCAQRLQQAVELYRGKFLEQFFLADSDAFEEWAVIQRESLHQRALDALSGLTAFYERRAEYDRARHCATRQLELDAWREQAHRQLMRALALGGEPSAALAQYEACRRVLADGLGVEPSAETRELYDEIRTGKLTSAMSESRAAPSNLPQPPTPFVGRRAELAELSQLLGEPQCRLLTLVGPGGIGKTRLAIECAAAQRDHFPGGVYFVPLSSLTSPQFVVPAIADAIGFAFSGPADSRAQLLNYMHDKHLLLVLDNFEHLVEAGALLVDLLQKAPLVKLLVTSRERLNLQIEWLYDLHGLSVTGSQVAEADDSGAVELFVQRARRFIPGMTLKPEGRQAVTRICQLVEGLPLAIELAATWVSTLCYAEIAAEIERNLDFLASGARDVPERHQSLRATFDHSWKLLSADERRLLCDLGVFQGGFQRDAAEQIAGATLPLLAALVSKSLVRRTESGRYDLHEVIRQYALAHLADDPEREAATRSRHSEYYLTYLRRRERALKSAALAETMRALTDEMDNLRAAWTWVLKQEDWASLASALPSIGRVFELASWLGEGIDQLESIAQALRAGPKGADQQKALGLTLTQQALLLFRWGKFDRALCTFEASLDLLRPFDDPGLLIHPLTYSFVIMHLNGDIDGARTRLQEQLACARAVGDDWFIAWALFNQGYLDSLQGRYEEGYQHMTDGLAMWRTLGDPQVIALGLNFINPTLVHLQRYAEAESNMRESLELCTAVGNRWGMGTAYRFWGLAALKQGELDKAESLIQKSLEVFNEFVTGWDIVRSLTYLGDIKVAAGDWPEAGRIFQQALVMAMQVRATPVALDALMGLASIHAHVGAIEQALEFSFSVAHHAAATEDTRQRAKQLISELSPLASPERVQAAQTRARLTSLDEMAARATYDIHRRQ